MPGATEAQRGHQIPGTGATNNCGQPRGCWEPNPGPRQEQPLLLSTKPSHQLLKQWFLLFKFLWISNLSQMDVFKKCNIFLKKWRLLIFNKTKISHLIAIKVLKSVFLISAVWVQIGSEHFVGILWVGGSGELPQLLLVFFFFTQFP